MGWKAIRDHYRIDHIVQVTSAGICIGSPYVHDMILIRDGVLDTHDCFGNDKAERYVAEMVADPAKLAELAAAPDTFERSITVYTYDGGAIVEKQCEDLGWPNPCHDGSMQFENTYSPDAGLVRTWAIDEARAGIKWGHELVAEAEEKLAKARAFLAQREANLRTLGEEELVHG